VKPVLIFPGGMPRSLEYLQACLRDGVPVIGASSLDYDVSRDNYPDWLFLPFITAPGFDAALQQALMSRDIGGIYTPNLVVWEYLSRRLSEIAPGVTLVNSSPVDSEVAPYHKALQFGAAVLAEPLRLAAAGVPRPAVSALAIAALFRHADGIPGMCDHEKIRALCELFRYAPSGDVVEIGSWWGKSAFVLNWLAACYGVGKLLCVDPWSNEHLIQKDEKGLVDRVPVNADEALTVFQLNLLPYAHGAVNYLRLPSVAAAMEYRHRREVTTSAFGQTTYAGCIAVLHVDGNHSYENARADVDAWTDLVAPGGWIVIDDYIWPYGDGPQRVGDEFLAANLDRIELAFVMGSALFVRLSPPSGA
jgi:predicted O-methyltransferase YrrM